MGQFITRMENRQRQVKDILHQWDCIDRPDCDWIADSQTIRHNIGEISFKKFDSSLEELYRLTQRQSDVMA